MGNFSPYWEWNGVFIPYIVIDDIVLCIMYYDWSTDHRRWLKRCLLIRGDHLKKVLTKEQICKNRSVPG